MYRGADGNLGSGFLQTVNGGIEAAFLFRGDLFAPTKQGSGGLAARHNQGETAQSGLGRLQPDHAGVRRGAGQNAEDGGTLRPGEFPAGA